MYVFVAHFLQHVSAKNCENWSTVDKVIAIRIGYRFFGTRCTYTSYISFSYTQ